MATGEDPTARVRLMPYRQAAAPDLDAGLDRIFFAASATRTFTSEAARLTFRELWLGQYLSAWPELATVAVRDDGRPIGYLVGSLLDPAHHPGNRAIGYFPLLADLTRIYPAHLHVNLDADWRGRGVGVRLVAAFAAEAASRGAPGLHVVTAAGSRNVAFYRRSGLLPVRDFTWAGSDLVMLARKLLPTDAGVPE